MFELLLPYMTGTAMGISPAGAGTVAMLPPAATAGAPLTESELHAAELQAAVAAMQAALGDGALVTMALAGADPAPDASPVRAPEPQVATGKFTTALEVKPILGMTQGNRVALRLYDGRDLMYFTQLVAWRCGLWEVRYGINGAPPVEVFPLEPCYTETAQPNVMVDMENYLPYLSFNGGSVETVIVDVTYDDGSKESARFARNQVLMPG